MNLSHTTMRKLVKLNASLLLNPKCPLWLQRIGLNLTGGLIPLPRPVSLDKSQLSSRSAWWFDYDKKRSESIILYFHGGGYSIGSPMSHKDLCSYLALYAEQSVVSLAYRLAPEHPYPAALDDAFAAYQTLISQGYESNNIALAGDSAGGGLALSLMLKLKANKLSQPACAFLISPLLIKTHETTSQTSQADIDPVINKSWGKLMAENYLQGSPDLLASACLSKKSIQGISPLLIHVGTDEVLLDDSLYLKQKAIRDSVKAQLITFPELWHVFHFTASLFKPARSALKQAAQFIKDHNQL